MESVKVITDKLDSELVIVNNPDCQSQKSRKRRRRRIFLKVRKNPDRYNIYRKSTNEVKKSVNAEDKENKVCDTMAKRKLRVRLRNKPSVLKVETRGRKKGTLNNKQKLVKRVVGNRKKVVTKVKVDVKKIKEIPPAQDAVTEEEEEEEEEEETESSVTDYEEESTDDDSCGGSQSGASIRPGVDLDIGTTLRRILEVDSELINQKNKVTF